MTIYDLILYVSLLVFGQLIFCLIAVYFNKRTKDEDYKMKAIIRIIKHRYDMLGLSDKYQYKSNLK
jgi:hypothetical protein